MEYKGSEISAQGRRRSHLPHAADRARRRPEGGHQTCAAAVILGVWFGLAVVVGGTIGAGVLRTPGPIMAHTGSAAMALVVWVVAGLFAMAAAACLAELATAVPKSGGFYVFARRALGDNFGFVAGSADWLANCAAVAYVGVSAAEYTRHAGAAAGAASAARRVQRRSCWSRRCSSPACGPAAAFRKRRA